MPAAGSGSEPRPVDGYAIPGSVVGWAYDSLGLARSRLNLFLRDNYGFNGRINLPRGTALCC